MKGVRFWGTRGSLPVALTSAGLGAKLRGVLRAARGQAIAPLAWGGDTGHRMAANDLVSPLAEAPERPHVELSATLGEGDAL